MSSWKSRLTSAGKKLYWKGFNLLREKTWNAHGYPVHYLYRKGTSDTLVVVFSAYASGLRPTYNYVRTLWKATDAHLLYIKDDFVDLPSGGGYYIGKGGDTHGLDAVCSLITEIRRRAGVRHVVGVGSSKGGTAALIFGMKLSFDALIIGACQYYIGAYMQEHKPDSLALLVSSGKPTAEDIAWLDSVAPRAVGECASPAPVVYLHYSDREHTYQEHIVDLLRDLRRRGVTVHEDVGSYEKHTDVSIYYVPYLQRTLPEVLKACKGGAHDEQP